MKRLLAVITLAAMLLSFMGTVAYADRDINDFSFTLRLGMDNVPGVGMDYRWSYVSKLLTKAYDRSKAAVQITGCDSSNTQQFQLYGEGGYTSPFWAKKGNRYTPSLIGYTVGGKSGMCARANTKETVAIDIWGNWSPDCKASDL